MNEFNITKEIVIKILEGVSFRMQKFKKELMDEYDLSFSNKNLSEIIGKIMEKVASDVFTKRLGFEVKRALADREPDLLFTKINKPMEIKITSTEDAWTGGEFSQRPFDYLLVSWGGDFDEFFCCLVHLQKEDWTSRMSKNYYGPSYNIRKLFERKDKIIFLGRLIDNGKSIKLIREKV